MKIETKLTKEYVEKWEFIKNKMPIRENQILLFLIDSLYDRLKENENKEK